MARPTRCERCGRENDPTFAFCLDCGSVLPRPAPVPPPTPAPSLPACGGCGARVLPGFRFCAQCGRAVAAAPPPPAAEPRPAPPAAHATMAMGAAATGLKLALVRNDGAPGPVFPLVRPETVCGRTEGDVRLPDDPTVSPRHARFTLEPGGLRVEDLGSVNGTFVRLRGPHRLAVGEELRIGRQLLRLEPVPRPALDAGARPWGAPDPGHRLRLAQLLEGGGLGEIFPLRAGENAIGREGGDVTFPADRYVSARHARIDVSAEEVVVTDLGSSNGTFVKVTGPSPVAPGDQLLVGAQLLRVDR